MAKRTPGNWIPWLLLAIVLAGGWMAWPRQPAQPLPARVGDHGGTSATTQPAQRPPPLDPAPARNDTASAARLPGFLPREARDTIAMIQRGGPFPHRQDGSVFGNREGRLPRQPRGWYREYTVDTPGLSHRGARRIVTGGNPPREWYYSDDHYDSFRRFDLPGATQ